jgi:hypothetical protein
MSVRKMLVPDDDRLYQLGGITGFGWTVSLLGYLSSLIGHGNSLIARLVTEPQSLLYIGGVLFLATFGIDRLQSSVSNTEE